MASDVAKWCKECLHCQRAKIHRHVHVRPQPIPVPGRRFSHIHVDLVGPLPASRGYTHLMTIIDRSTRWLEAVPLASTAAADCARALAEGWVARFGAPHTITSDRGAQFTSQLWRDLCTQLGTLHITTTAYHPEANGMVERVHRRLKDALRARCAAADWADHLPWVLLGLRAATREDGSPPPAEAVYGAPLVLPGQTPIPKEVDLLEFTTQFSRGLGSAIHPPPRHNTAADRRQPEELPADLQEARHVLVLRGGHVPPLAPLYDGPYEVLERTPRFFKLQVGPRTDTVSTGRLKPFSAIAVTPAAPPRRGRPKKVRFLLPDPASVAAAPPAAPRGTVFPGNARPGFCTPPGPSTGRSQRQRRPPARLNL